MTLKTAERFAGIDVMRGLAAFGVICIHAGLVVDHRVSPAAAVLPDVFGFVVPFFLVAAFFFAIRSEKAGPLGWRDWMRGRASRLLIPYAIWSAVYLGLHVLKLVSQSQKDRIGELFQNPWALLLNGGTSVALYFLPLLFVGLVLVHGLKTFILRAPSWGLGCALLMTAAVNEAVCLSGNGFDLDDSSGFRSVWPPAIGSVGFILGLLAHAIRCLPLIFATALMVRFFTQSEGHQRIRAALGAAIMMVIFVAMLLGGGNRFMPEFVIGTGAFLVGWALPVNEARWTILLGTFSFGVYLVHQVVLEAMQLLVHKWNGVPVLGVAGYLGLTLLAFVISMLVVGVASRGGLWVRRIFGLR